LSHWSGGESQEFGVKQLYPTLIDRCKSPAAIVLLHGPMEELRELLTGFLQPYLSGPLRDGKPWTILTWAQSLDAKIAPSTRLPMALSSLETKYMTHLIRREVDAILIGAGTAVTDNPSLNGKYRLDDQPID